MLLHVVGAGAWEPLLDGTAFTSRDIPSEYSIILQQAKGSSVVDTSLHSTTEMKCIAAFVLLLCVAVSAQEVAFQNGAGMREIKTVMVSWRSLLSRCSL